MVAVKFNIEEEFLDELEKEKGNVHRRIVRITLCRTAGTVLGFYNLSIIATFLVVAKSSTLPVAGDQIVILKKPLGSIHSADNDMMGKVRESAESSFNELRTTITAMGFDVRAGVYESGGDLNASKAP